jgi:hypothetical protein
VVLRCALDFIFVRVSNAAALWVEALTIAKCDTSEAAADTRHALITTTNSAVLRTSNVASEESCNSLTKQPVINYNYAQ